MGYPLNNKTRADEKVDHPKLAVGGLHFEI